MRIYRALGQALGIAVRWGWLSNNLCDRIDTPMYQPERKELWSQDELEEFLEGTKAHRLNPL